MPRFPDYRGGLLSQTRRGIMKNFFGNAGENQVQTITRNVYGYDHVPYAGACFSKDFTQNKRGRMIVTGSSPVVSE